MTAEPALPFESEYNANEANPLNLSGTNSVNVDYDVEFNEDESFDYEFDLITYGSDPTVADLVDRLHRERIVIPDFQRSFVWTLPKASLFIHSLLIGFPIPPIFLASNRVDNRFDLIDGQQRLTTLYRFIHKKKWNGKEFKLILSNSAKYNNKSYEQLDVLERDRLRERTIHAITIDQRNPKKEQSDSIFYVYQRINSGGVSLKPQEIRSAIYHGPFNEWLSDVVGVKGKPEWKMFFPKPFDHMREQELIVRFLAAFYNQADYKPPMTTFINLFMKSNQNLQKYSIEQLDALLTKTLRLIGSFIGNLAFSFEKNPDKKRLNVALFESVMVAFARLGEAQIPESEKEAILTNYQDLLKDDEFRKSCESSTAEAKSFHYRLNKAKELLVAPFVINGTLA
jgi:hypothetical protein